MKRLIILMIDGYQRYLSPYKRFRCAYKVETGGRSCSAFGKNALKRRGVMIGAFLIFRRIGKCSQAYRASKLPLHQRELKIAAPELQSGHCDLPVDACYPGDPCGASSACDTADCFTSFPCDLGFGNKSKSSQEINNSRDPMK